MTIIINEIRHMRISLQFILLFVQCPSFHIMLVKIHSDFRDKILSSSVIFWSLGKLINFKSNFVVYNLLTFESSIHCYKIITTLRYNGSIISKSRCKLQFFSISRNVNPSSATESLMYKKQEIDPFLSQ